MLLYIALVSLRPTSAGPPPIASNKCQGARMMMRQTFPRRASPFLPPQVGPLGDVMRYETLWKHGVHMEWILWSNYIKLICEDHFGQTLTLDLAGIVQGKPWCRSSWKSHGSHRWSLAKKTMAKKTMDKVPLGSEVRIAFSCSFLAKRNVSQSKPFPKGRQIRQSWQNRQMLFRFSLFSGARWISWFFCLSLCCRSSWNTLLHRKLHNCDTCTTEGHRNA